MILSQPVQQIVKEAILRTNSCNRFVLCEEISIMLQERYPGGKLEYQSNRMSLGSTKQILNAIDSYFFCYVQLPTINEEEFDDFELY